MKWGCSFLVVVSLVLLDGTDPVAAQSGPQSNAEQKLPRRAVTQKSAPESLPPGAVARLGTASMRHGGSIASVALSPDGKLLASGGGWRLKQQGPESEHDAAIRLWETATGRLIWEVQTPGAEIGFPAVGALAFSADGRTLASGCGGFVCLWDVNTGKELRRLGKGADGTIQSVRFLPNDKTLVAKEYYVGGRPYHYAFAFWELPGGKFIKRLEPNFPEEKKKSDDRHRWTRSCHGGVLSPDGRALVWFTNLWHGFGLSAAIGPRKTTVCETDAGKVIGQLGDHRRWLAFSPKGDVFVTAKQAFQGAVTRTVFSLWQVKGWQKLKDWNSEIDLTLGPDPPVVSPDGNQLAIPHSETIDFHDIRTGTLVRRLRLPCCSSCWLFCNRTHGRYHVHCAFSADGTTLAVAHHSVLTVFDLTTGRPFPEFPGHRYDVEFLRFSQDGRSLQSGGGLDLCTWDTITWKQLNRSPRFNPDVMREFKGYPISPADGRFVSVEQDGKLLFREMSGKIQCRLDGTGFRDPLPLAEGVLSSNGQVLAFFQRDAGESGVETTDLFSLPSGKKLAPCSFDRNGSLVFSADDRFVAWSNLEGVSLGDLRTLRVAHRFARRPPMDRDQISCNPVTYLAFSPDGRYLASAPAPTYTPVREKQDDFLRLWDLLTGREVARWPIPGYEPNAATVSCLAVAPDNRIVAVGFIGKATIVLADMQSGERVQIAGHQEPVISLAFHPDGQLLASGSEDTTAFIWDVTQLLRHSGEKTKDLTENELTILWKTVASADPQKAYLAVRKFVQYPGASVAFLQKVLKPVTAANSEEAERLLKKLDSPNYGVRSAAQAELEKIGDIAAPALEQALNNKITLEKRRRLEKLLVKAATFPPPPEKYAAFRALEILEHINTPEAQQLLQTLSRGASGAMMTEFARASLLRSKR